MVFLFFMHFLSFHTLSPLPEQNPPAGEDRQPTIPSQEGSYIDCFFIFSPFFPPHFQKNRRLTAGDFSVSIHKKERRSPSVAFCISLSYNKNYSVKRGILI